MAKRARRSRKVSDAPTGIAPDSAPVPVAPLTFAADHAGSSADVMKTVVPVSGGAQLRRSAAPAPPLPPRISPADDVEPDDDDDDTDEQPAPTQTVEPATAIDTPPTPVEVAAEPTDEEMPPLPVILDALFGPSTGKPRELVMADPPPVATPVQPDPEEQTMPTQIPPVSPGPRENDPISKQLKTFGIICTIGIPAAMLIGLNFKNPLTPHPAEVAANVAATKIADATPPRPAEVPTPPSDEDASAPSDEAVAADEPEPPATPKPTAELVPSAGMGGPTIVLPVAPPVVAAVAPPASKPSVTIPAAKLAAPSSAEATDGKPAPVAAKVDPIPLAKTTAAPVAAVVPPVIKVALTTPVAKPAAATVPATILVSATGKHPGCTAPCAWGNVDPADAYPYTVNGKRVVTCGDATYTVGKWTRINDGPQTYCYTVSDVTAN